MVDPLEVNIDVARLKRILVRLEEKEWGVRRSGHGEAWSDPEIGAFYIKESNKLLVLSNPFGLPPEEESYLLTWLEDLLKSKGELGSVISNVAERRTQADGYSERNPDPTVNPPTLDELLEAMESLNF